MFHEGKSLRNYKSLREHSLKNLIKQPQGGHALPLLQPSASRHAGQQRPQPRLHALPPPWPRPAQAGGESNEAASEPEREPRATARPRPKAG